MKTKKRKGLPSPSHSIRTEYIPLLSVITLCAITVSTNAQDNQNNAESKKSASASSDASAGILPVPDYTGGFWERDYLTGDWGGVRTDLANKGVQFGLDWNQYFQGIVAGGRDTKSEYGGNVDYTLNLDLMRMGVLKGALVKFRAESRYGSSVNRGTGLILPVNSDAYFPLTKPIDEDIPITVTDLNYTQFLSKHLGVYFGKMDTLDSDLNEFASGRGTSQFMNMNFIFSPALLLRLPYRTLAAGAVWMPIPPSPKGSITITSTVLNTEDSSTTTGFNDFDKGQSSYSEIDFQYRLGKLPGGMNFAGLYSFNQDFAHLNTQIIFHPGEGLSIPKKDSTWAATWSAWQYLFTCGTNENAIDLTKGQADLKGVGLFARFGYSDKDTNPLNWNVSGGVGGRGIFPTRDNDTFGVGYYYNHFETLRLISLLPLRDSTQGFECFYSIAITPAVRITGDVQVVESVQKRLETATILGLRASMSF